MTDNPLSELDRAFQRLGRKLEGVGGDSLVGTVLVDVEDRGDAYVVTADLPGFEREAIDVRVLDGTLELSASRADDADAEGRYLRRERHRGSASRSVYLPDTVDPDQTEATYERGVLTVTLPKTDSQGGTDIPVN